MNRPLVCVGALVWGKDGRVLLVQTTKWRGLWGVPGGKVEWGETLLQAVQREFLEEVGLHLEDVQFHVPAHMLLVDFLATTADQAVTPNEEIGAWAWVHLHEALEYPLNSFTRSLVELAVRQGEI